MPDWLNITLLIALIGFVGGACYWAGGVNKSVSTLEELMKEIRQDIKNILTRLPKIPFSSGSPLQLTEFGKDIANKLNAYEWAVEFVKTLSVDLKRMEPFQINEFCSNLISIESKEKENDSEIISKAAYEFGISKKDIIKIYIIVLREELLKLKNKNCTIE